MHVIWTLLPFSLVFAQWGGIFGGFKRVPELLKPPCTLEEWTAYTHDVLIFYAHHIDDLQRPELERRAERYGMEGVVRFRQMLACRRENIDCPNTTHDDMDYGEEF
jgi:hypothetical protein